MSASGQTIGQRYGFENPFKTDPLIRRAARYFPAGGRALDLGCGEGADSVFLSRRGLRVTAIDRNGDYIRRFRRYSKDMNIRNLTIVNRDVASVRFPRDRYDVVISILAICCMKRSEFEHLLNPLKQSVRRGGVVVISSRNYLDPELRTFRRTERAVEPNTYRHAEGCSRYLYFIEKNRLRDLFSDFRILYYHEGYAACKYGEHPRHGDSYIICRKPG